MGNCIKVDFGNPREVIKTQKEINPDDVDISEDFLLPVDVVNILDEFSKSLETLQSSKNQVKINKHRADFNAEGLTLEQAVRIAYKNRHQWHKYPNYYLALQEFIYAKSGISHTKEHVQHFQDSNMTLDEARFQSNEMGEGWLKNPTRFFALQEFIKRNLI